MIHSVEPVATAIQAVQVDYNGPCGARLLSVRPLVAGQRIGSLAADSALVEVPRPTRYSIQVGAHRHVEHRGAFAYLNHSCAPTCAVDSEGLAVVLLCSVAAGAELTLFYPATEWEMAEPFTCRCGAPGCLRRISGARYVAREHLQRYAISPHIRDLWHAPAAPAEPRAETG